MNVNQSVTKQVLLEKQRKMEEEVQQLQQDFKDQIERINVKTYLEIERLQPVLDKTKGDKERLEKELEETRKERQQLQRMVKVREVKNDKLMSDYCNDKKAHSEQIVNTTKRADIKDQFIPTEMTLSIVRQQKAV